MTEALLPAAISVQDFDALHDEPSAWRGAIEALVAELGGGTLMQVSENTVLVGLWGADRVLKLYPPHLRDHCLFERTALRQLHGRLRLPTPALLASGDHHGWPYTVMSRLQGEVLTPRWLTWDEPARCLLLQ